MQFVESEVAVVGSIGMNTYSIFIYLSTVNTVLDLPLADTFPIFPGCSVVVISDFLANLTSVPTVSYTHLTLPTILRV